MLIQCPSITTDQVKVAILPLVFQREASLVVDNPQEPVEKVGDTRRDSFLRRGSLFGSPAVAQPPEKLKKHEIDPFHLKGTELWPLEEGQGGNSADRDIGAGWVPIYVSFCSLTDNLLYEDNRYVIITDHHIHVTKPILWERKVDFQHAFEHSIRIDRIIDAKAEVRRCHTFHAPFQHLVIKHKEMSLIKPPGVRMPLRHYSVCNTVETLVLRTSIKVWELPRYLSRARINSNIRSLFTTAVYHDIHELERFHELEAKLEAIGRLDPAKKLKHHLDDIQKKAVLLRKIAEIANANRAVKSAFWKSMIGYRFLMDEIEACFTIVKKFTEQTLYPRKKRSEAELAALVGLKPDYPGLKRPSTVSEEYVLLAIRYNRKCIQLFTIMIFDTEQVPARTNIFRQLSPYGFTDLVKILIAGSSLEAHLRGPTFKHLSKEIQETKKVQDKSLGGFTKLLDDLRVLPRASVVSNHSDSVSASSEQPIEPAPPPSPWATAPVRFVPGTKNRNRASLLGTSAAFASWTDNGRNPSQLTTESTISLDQSSSLKLTSSQGESFASVVKSPRQRKSFSDSTPFLSPSREGSLKPDIDPTADTVDLDVLDDGKTNNFIYTGEEGKIDLWNAKWHGNTKSAFKIQKKLEDDARKERTKLQKQAMDSLQSNASNSTKRMSTPHRVKFDILDVTTLLSLPLPPLPPERTPAVDPWDFYDSDDSDADGPRLNTQAATLLKSGISIANINMQKVSLNNGYPTDEQFEKTDLHPKSPSPDLKFVHSSFRINAIDSAVMLWELCFISRLESNCAIEFDATIRKHWIGHLENQKCGWFPAVGGMSACMGFVIAILHKDLDATMLNEMGSDDSLGLSFGITETKTILFSELLPPRVLSILYRVVLLINHVLFDVDGVKPNLQFWDEEFKFLLTKDLIRQKFGHDARPIAQSIVDQLLRLTEGISLIQQ